MNRKNCKTGIVGLAIALGMVVHVFADTVLHPILTISGSGSGASTVTNISESTYTNNFIPRTPPRNNSFGFVPPVVSGDTSWSWSSATPNQIKSLPSGIVFPPTNTVLYPLRTQVVAVFLTTATNNLTRNVNAVYYNKAGSTTSKSLVLNLIDYNKLGQLRSDLNKLAPAYISSSGTPATRNDNYARRIAIALLDWSRWHPLYYMNQINSATYADVTPNFIMTTGGFGLQRASDHNGLAHEWQDDELKAFDAIYNSVAMTNLSAELGFNVRDFIRTNLFFDEGDFLVNHVRVDVAIQSNLSGPYSVLALVARVLDRPDYILWLDSYLNATVQQKLRRDGVLEEGLGYSIGYLNENQDAAQNTRDYFLTRAATNSLLLAISNRATIYNKTLQYGQSQWATVALPNGQLPSFGDTPFNNYFTARNNGTSAVLPAYGHLSLGSGSSASAAVQLNQNFSGNNNHMRADTAAFTLWAFGNPYLENIRYYNPTPGRQFDEQMLSHNTITIDRVNETFPDADTSGNANLTIYEPGNSGLAMTELDGQRDYSNKASRFQRLLLLNTVEQGKPYVVDVFRVTGGTNHDYVLHGAIRWDQTWECSFPLITNTAQHPMLQGETWVEPTSSGSAFPYYGYWRNVSSNIAPGNFQLMYRDANRATARDTKLWMTADPNAYNVYLGMTPNPGRDNTVPDNFYVYWRPSAIIRHRVPSGSLQDLYVSVIEPFNVGASNIVSVQRLPMSGNALESCGLKITFKDGRVDTYIVNLRNPKIAGTAAGATAVSTADGQYLLNGRVGLQVDRPAGNESRVWNINATDFKYPGRQLTTPIIYYSGLIAGETRKLTGGAYDAFTTATSLPVGTVLRNKYLSLTHGTLSGSGTTNISEMFKIDQVVLTNGLYHVVFTNDHMLEIAGATSVEQVAPLRTFTSSNSFEIVLTAEAAQISAITDQNIPPSTTSLPINFTYGNLGGTAGGSLQLLATSSNQTLIPNANIVISGNGSTGSLTITPAPGQTGKSQISVSVTDGAWTNSRVFNVMVADFTVVTTPLAQSILAGGTVVFTNRVSATNGTGTVSFDVIGLPAGSSGAFSPPTFIDSGTNLLTLITSTNAVPGTYPLTISAMSGSQSNTTMVTLVITNIVAAPGTLLWMGTNNWSTPMNWTNLTAGGYGPPGISNDVLFLDLGAVSSSNVINNVVNYDVAVKSLTYSQSNGFHTTQINPGKTLGVSGSAGLLVGTEADNGLAQAVRAVIRGGKLVITNGNLIVRQGTANSGGSQRATLDLSGVNEFYASLSRVVIGSEGANPRPTATLLLGKTNTIIATGSSPAIAMAGNGGGSGNSGGISQIYLGQDNTILANSLTVGRGKQGTSGGNSSVMAFNPAWTNNDSPPSVYFRATDGTNRVGNWTLSDSGSSGGTVNTAGVMDFRGGTVDAIVNTLTVAKSSTGSGLGNPTATFFMGAGEVDVNTLQIGVQGANGANFATGTVNVNGGLFIVRTNLQMAVTVGGDGATNTVGTLNLNGGTIEATNVINAGPGIAVININSGVLNLCPDWANGDSGRLVNISTLHIGAAGQSGVAELINARTVSSLNMIDIAANGLLAGNTTITTPFLRVAGAISPGGDGIGGITNSGVVVMDADGHYKLDFADADESGTNNWDKLITEGPLSVQATSTNRFVIELRSLDENNNDENTGAANFVNSSAQDWLIAAGSYVTNFSPGKFLVDNSAFQNDLAGGYFIMQTNSAGLLLSFVNNNPPSARDLTVHVALDGTLAIPISTLAPLWNDPDGDAVQLVDVAPDSVNGTNNVSVSTNFIYYLPTGGTRLLPDDIVYTIVDQRMNPPEIYRTGDSKRTATGIIHVLPPPTIESVLLSGSSFVFNITGGIPDEIFYTVTTTNLTLPVTNWELIGTNQFDAMGRWKLTNELLSDEPARWYRLLIP